MNTCKNCGKPVDENEAFCTNCGYEINKFEQVKPEYTKEKKSKLPIIIIVIVLLIVGGAVGIILSKDTIMYKYYLQKGNKETSISQSIEYYTSALELKYDTEVINKISEKLKQDENFEETLEKIEPVLQTSDIEKIYRDIYVKKAKENFREKNYETTLSYLSKAQSYGYDIEDFEYYNDLQKIQQQEMKQENKDDKTVHYDNKKTNSSSSYNYSNYYEYFIIYDSNTRYLTTAELSYYSKDDLAYIRNEIYARHGYMFKKEKYQNYFSSMPWYTPNPYFSGNMSQLNKVEVANIELIKKLEN